LENREITLSISISSNEEDRYKINAVVYDNEKRFAKLSMLFVNK